MVTDSNREVSFVIEKRLGVLSSSQNGWRKELNFVSWNGKPAKLDIREWSPDHTRMAKGVTLRYEEARLLQRELYRWVNGYGKQMAEGRDKPAKHADMQPAEDVQSADDMPAEDMPFADSDSLQPVQPADTAEPEAAEAAELEAAEATETAGEVQ